MSAETLEEIRMINEMYPDGIHKKSEAKEMFEKLRYENIQSRDKTLLKYERNSMKKIWFDLENKEILLDGVCYFTLKEIQAINKQIEELGWNK